MPTLSTSQICTIVLMHFEHYKGSRSSGVATLFWLLAIIADGIRLRTTALQYEVNRCGTYWGEPNRAKDQSIDDLYPLTPLIILHLYCDY